MLLAGDLPHGPPEPLPSTRMGRSVLLTYRILLHAREWAEEERNAALAQLAGDTAPTMPPRERLVESRNVDYIVGRGNLASVQVSMYSVAPYITTGAVQAAAVCKLLENDTRKVGFASACQAFGHDYLLAYLEERGLCRAKVY